MCCYHDRRAVVRTFNLARVAVRGAWRQRQPDSQMGASHTAGKRLADFIPATMPARANSASSRTPSRGSEEQPLLRAHRFSESDLGYSKYLGIS